jgi:glycosyltransferase involved in cell wall biosynthesis
MSSPWLSILVPVYDVAPYIEACVASILDQDVSGVEVIFVDDASPRGEGAILAAVQARHPDHVRVVTHPVNRGIAVARNTLLEEARGDYLWFVDSDDTMAAGSIRALREVLDTHRPDLVMCDFKVVPELGEADVQAPKRRFGRQARQHARNAHVRSFHGLSNVLSRDRDHLIHGLFNRGQMHAWSKIVRRDAWSPSLRFAERRDYEDLELMPRVALSIGTFIHVPQTWIHYRQRPGSMISTPTPARMHDRMVALAGSGRQLRDPDAGFSRATLFAVAHFATRDWRDCNRVLRSFPPSTAGGPTPASLREAWKAAVPLSVPALTWAYLRRGQFRRCLQMHALLRED